MYREVEEVKHSFGAFPLNTHNTPLILSRLRLMLKFLFWFLLNTHNTLDTIPSQMIINEFKKKPFSRFVYGI